MHAIIVQLLIWLPKAYIFIDYTYYARKARQNEYKQARKLVN